MTFADLVAGDVIFIDANTFIYHFANDPILGPPCNQLLAKSRTELSEPTPPLT